MKMFGSELEDIGHSVDLEDMIRDGNRYFKGGTNRPFPAWKAESFGEIARFLVELGARAGDIENPDIDAGDADTMAERIMVEDLGMGLVFGFPGVELTD